MKLYYCKTEQGNFGDDLNTWLWPELLPGLFDDDESCQFLAIGTLLTNRFPWAKQRIVFGTGAGYKQAPDLTEKSWNVYCVRGPLTARTTGIDPSLAVTDPALLVREKYQPNLSKIYPFAYMPHYMSLSLADWSEICSMCGIHLIDPRWPVEQVLEEIDRTEILISEAMHGAIVADALRVPWIPVRAYSRILEFKWFDWTQSMGLEYHPVDLPTVCEKSLPRFKNLCNRVRRKLRDYHLGPEKWSRAPVYGNHHQQKFDASEALRQVVATGAPQLSSDKMFERRLEQLKDTMGYLKNDFQQGRFN